MAPAATKKASLLKRKASDALPKSKEPQASKKSKRSKPVPKAATPERSEAESSSAAVAGKPQEEDESEEEEEVHLHGFSSDDDDSSDEEDLNDKPSAFDPEKLPTIAKDDETVRRKLAQAKKQTTEERGVLYIGRLPHGFYEDQLKAYFSQFGNVTRLRVSRNKKTGKSKHYCFLEFDSLPVAEIVAETMDNYLLMGHILRCKIIPKNEVHPELWVGANRKWRTVPRDRIVRVEHDRPRTTEEQARASKRLLKRQNERKRKLEKAGIDYNFDAVAYKKPIAVV
ncbi:hypothetical protein C8J56DRAFT_858097 [Mycena floridula]|nr:hypothetical protein C8J56DRAFT_858097 [Mycena floridula]